MGKRSSFEKVERDLYETPPEAIAPLLSHIERRATFVEPCAGAGKMVDYLESANHPCVFASDIEPLRHDIMRLSALEVRYIRADYIITNPPWTRSILHPMIDAFTATKIPTWLLVDADWLQNLNSAPWVDKCSMVVPIGRVKWFPGTEHTGMDNAIWALFSPGHTGGPRIIPRRKIVNGERP